MFCLDHWNRYIQKYNDKEEGVAMVVALIVLVVGALLIPPLLHHIGTGLNASEVHRESTERLYSADAGVEQALADLKDSGTPPAIGPVADLSFDNPFQINDKDVSVEVYSYGNGDYKITSSASETEGSTKAIVSYAHIVPTYSEAGGYCMYAFGDDDPETVDVLLKKTEIDDVIEMDGNPANIYCNGTIEISNTVTMPEDSGIWYTDDMDLHPNNDNIDEETQTHYVDDNNMGQVVDAPIRDFSGIIAQVTSVDYPDSIPPVSFSDGDEISDTVYYDGNLTISANNVVFKGDVRVDGTLTINTNGEVTFERTVYVYGDLKVPGQAIINLGNTFYVTGIPPDADENDPPPCDTTAIDVTGGVDFKCIGETQYVITNGPIKLAGGSAIWNEEDILAVIVSTRCDIKTGGTNDVVGVLYAPYGTVDMGGTAIVIGAVIAQQIEATGNQTVIYDERVGDIQFPCSNPGEITVIYWKANY